MYFNRQEMEEAFSESLYPSLSILNVTSMSDWRSAWRLDYEWETKTHFGIGFLKFFPIFFFFQKANVFGNLDKLSLSLWFDFRFAWSNFHYFRRFPSFLKNKTSHFKSGQKRLENKCSSSLIKIQSKSAIHTVWVEFLQMKKTQAF